MSAYTAHAAASRPGVVAPHGGWLQKAAQALRPQPQSWRLQRGQAISLRVRHAGLLQVHSGTAWVTQRGAMPGDIPTNSGGNDSASTDSGDVFLHAGQALSVSRGQHLVLEPAGSGPGADQGFVAGMWVRETAQR